MLTKIDMPKDKLLSYSMLVAAFTVWGFSYIFTRVALRSSSPETLLTARFFFSVLTANAILLTGKVKLSLRGKKLGGLLLFGLLEPVLYYILESYGILFTNATVAGATLALNPVVSLVLAVIFLKEQPSRRQKIFIWLPIAGVLLVTLSTYTNESMRAIGVVFLLACSLCVNFGRIVNRSISPYFTAFERTYVMLTMGFVSFTVMALIKSRGNFAELVQPMLVPSFAVSTIVLGVICSFAANFCVNYAAARLTVTQIAVFPSLSTVISITAGALILGEPITFVSIIGAVLIVTGIWNVTR